MNNDTVILELLKRIQTLEDKVGVIEGKMFSTELDELREFIIANNLVNKKPKKSKHEFLEDVKRILVDRYHYRIKKGSRQEGGGLVIQGMKRNYNLKVLTSRIHENNAAGWHSLDHRDLNKESNIDFYIFIVYDDNFKNEYFIFTKEMLLQEFYDPADPKEKVHLYFRLKEDGMPVECRQDERDMGAYYGNWEVFKGL